MNISWPSRGIKLLLLLSICLTQGAMAQTYIDEDFLDNLDKNARFMLAEPAAAFATNSVPSKWDKESAVIMGFSRSILFDRQSSGGFFTRKERSLYFLEKIHLKVRLNDKNAVQAFSQIYFRHGLKEDGFVARIIKSDGTTTDIDLKTSVGVEGADIPEYFQSFFDQVANSNYQYYKVPVGNLEPGDILEYVTTTRSRLDVRSSGYIEFSPIYEVCSKTYPVMYNEIIIETDDKSFFKSLSLNGAPVFTRENAAEKGFFRYVLTDRDRETEKDVNFVSPLLQYPVVKFQVIYSNNDHAKGALIGEKGELKTEFTKEELARKAWEEYESAGGIYLGPQGPTVQSFIGDSWSELSKLGAKGLAEQQYIDQVYYLIRNKVLFQRQYLSDKAFAFIFSSLLNRRDIRSEILITTGNNIGRLNQVLFDQEIRYLVKVNAKLYFNVTDFSNPGELNENLLDNASYIIYAPAKRSGLQEIKPFSLPSTSASDNTAEVSITSELSPDMKSLLVARTSSYKGIHKTKYITGALKYIPYMIDDYRNYGGNAPTDKMKSKEIEEYDNSVRALKEEFKKDKPDYVKDALESEYHTTVKNVHFNLVSDGRTQKKNTLTVKEGFEVSDFVHRAGKKYLINLAGLIGSQLQIKKEERDRKYDIDVRYPRSLAWNISFKIPGGYTAAGLTELNREVDNETGTFSISAREENGAVVIRILKVYKARNISKDKWKDMLAFIDAAYNSSFKYILLEPK